MTSEVLLVDELLQFHEYIPRKKEGCLELNNLFIDTIKESAILDSKRVMITGGALKILCALIEKKGVYMRHHELFGLLYPTKKYIFKQASVSNYIMNLRNKLGRDIIFSTHGEGYKINVDYGRGIKA